MKSQHNDRRPEAQAGTDRVELAAVMLFDGDCEFCRFWIDCWKRKTGAAVRYRPYQELTEQEMILGVTVEDLRRAVHLISPDGSVCRGAEAALRALAYRRSRGLALWMYEKVPGVGPLLELGYRFVARHRNGLYRLTRMLYGSD